MNRKVILVIVILILLAVPTVLLIASGDFSPKEKDPYKVGFISESGHDTVFVRNAIDGVYNATLSQDGNIDAELYRLSKNDFDSILELTSQAIRDGADLVVSAGYEAGAPLLNISTMYPETSFVLVDVDVTDFPDNYADIVFRSQEPSFIAGYIAGRMTNTGIVGFLGGIPSDSVQMFYYGFKAGVETAGISSGSRIELLTEYTNSFSDKNLGYDVAKRMYDEGADIIFTVAGDSGLGAIQAAKELGSGNYIIGVDTDQNYLAPLNVLFSVTKKLSHVVSQVVQEYADNYDKGVSGGDFSKDENGIISVGYAEDGVGIETMIDVVPGSLKLEAAYIEGIIRDDGLVIPTTQEEYDKWIPPNLLFLT